MPRHRERGDATTSVALRIAGSLGCTPIEAAHSILSNLELDATIASSIEIAEPGYINIHLAPLPFHLLVEELSNDLLRLRDPECRSAIDGGALRASIDAVIADIASGRTSVRYRGADPPASVEALIADIGVDRLRFAVALQGTTDAPTVDLDVVRMHSSANPCCAVQYARADIAALHRHVARSGTSVDAVAPFSRLTGDDDLDVMGLLVDAHDRIERSVRRHDAGLLGRYLLELAEATTAVIGANAILGEEAPRRDAHLRLLAIAASVLAGGLALLGIEAADRI
jgi:arginyl-tRNA synthetase